MTHEDIYTKFMIEYDKAQITSSYPSLTPYEIAVILDKAYLAFISQKLTGNNPRQAPFEADTKAIEDVRPLLTTKDTSLRPTTLAQNGMCCTIPSDMLYYVQSTLAYDDKSIHTVDLISHDNAKRFMKTSSNNPWIKNAVAYIEGDQIIFLYDAFEPSRPVSAKNTYVINPKKFAIAGSKTDFSKSTKFELSDSASEEVVNLAIMFAAENVESPRMSSKAQIRTLEA